MLDEQPLQFHEMSLDDDRPVAERLQSPPRRIDSLWVAINAEDFAVRITGFKDVKGVPTITHGAVQVDPLTTGPEPEEDFCGYNRDVLSVAAKLTSTNFTTFSHAIAEYTLHFYIVNNNFMDLWILFPTPISGRCIPLDPLERADIHGENVEILWTVRFYDHEALCWTGRFERAGRSGQATN